MVQEPCLALRPCKNGGTCRVTSSGWSCSCPPAWQGERCRQPLDPCLQKPPVCGDKRWGCRRASDKPAGFICDCNAKGWGPRSGAYWSVIILNSLCVELQFVPSFCNEGWNYNWRLLSVPIAKYIKYPVIQSIPKHQKRYFTRILDETSENIPEYLKCLRYSAMSCQLSFHT